MTSSFSIQPIGRFAGASQPVKRPKVCRSLLIILAWVTNISQEFACFSYDDDHQFHQDASSLRYYYTPQLGADLSSGFEKFQKQDDSPDEHIDSLLKTIISHEQETGTRIDAKVVTWRGMMTKVNEHPDHSIWQPGLTAP